MIVTSLETRVSIILSRQHRPIDTCRIVVGSAFRINELSLRKFIHVCSLLLSCLGKAMVPPSPLPGTKFQDINILAHDFFNE